MRLMVSLLVLSVLAMVTVTLLKAQTTRPVESTISPGALELRANTLFSQGDYAAALPVLLKVAQDMKERSPDRLGPIQEKLRVCQRNLAAAGPKVDRQAQLPDRLAAPAMAASKRTAHVRPKDNGILEIPIKQLGNFDYDAEKGGNIPADVKQLSGIRLRTRGFMMPLDQVDNFTEFALMPSLFACCFGQPPQVQHTLLVHCPKGKAVSYIPDEVVVEGTLKVDEKKDEGLVISIFEIDCTSVKPAAK